MKKIKTYLDRVIEKLLITIFGLMVINVIWQVITRYFSENPSSFTDELSRYLMIWLGILGAAYVTGKNEHVSIDFFIKKISVQNRKILTLFITLSIICFAIIALVIGGGRLVYITLILQQYSPSLKIPLALVYSILPISGILIIFYKITEIPK
ncbi:TRAP transporter small permease [bacterium]|jgi:TRAP-type C4-dicarboxylate transport system permease small subunit|nr:TRAP transporter small permease [Flavobacteriaceae bacterium]MDA9642792.1 TRAP transporter small permease [bacterium]MDA9668719.1 TRAP transporter small permease [Flavobacteriaceae bacterium]MDB4063251.1 TRAP transporter small permease [Flavobacteriaceae bacterium]MDC1392475.1 TRAP transporter small permease [Flavobacteriaceae bacterium]|tara:strand:+ start:1397 stop:1855 length:459 start_codon:yes stop_codon:yes gene_type:complete